nr:reverse transcriptase domain-containing protein [Tanacetum cinerariifolium]
MHYRERPRGDTIVLVAHLDPDDPYVSAATGVLIVREKTPSSELRGSPRDLKIMAPRKMFMVVIEKLVANKLAEAIAMDQATRVNASGSGGLVDLETEMKRLMTREFCPPEKIQRMEHELWNLKVKDLNISAYTQRSNELVLLCPTMVLTDHKKIEAYIKGLSENIKGDVTSSKPTSLIEAIWSQAYCRVKVVATGANAQPTVTCFDCGERGHVRYNCPKKNNQPAGNAQGQVYTIKDANQKQGPNMFIGTFLLNNRYAYVLFDSGSDRSFVNTSFSCLIDISPVKLGVSYEVELADVKIVSTDTILRCCTLNLVNHLFEIDLMPIELGTFDVIIGMDWLVEHDVVIVCGKKVVHVPYENKTLVVDIC